MHRDRAHKGNTTSFIVSICEFCQNLPEHKQGFSSVCEASGCLFLASCLNFKGQNTFICVRCLHALASQRGWHGINCIWTVYLITMHKLIGIKTRNAKCGVLCQNVLHPPNPHISNTSPMLINWPNSYLDTNWNSEISVKLMRTIDFTS